MHELHPDHRRYLVGFELGEAVNHDADRLRALVERRGGNRLIIE
jgi:hypothetical protein